jgi:hypothetical protein
MRAQRARVTVVAGVIAALGLLAGPAQAAPDGPIEELPRLCANLLCP